MSSYSFHISSKGHAIKNMQGLKSAYSHNYRRYANQKGYNRDSVFELLQNCCQDAKEYAKKFNEIFYFDVQEYNKAQKRDDRKIFNYFQKICDDVKKDVAVEIIVQVAEKKFWEKEENSQKRGAMEKVFKGQIEELKKILPGFILTNAALHQDETSPHLHIIGIPRAEGFKGGMRHRCAKTRIFTREKLAELQDRMRENAEILMRENGFENFKFDRKEKGRNFDYTKEEIIQRKKIEEKVIEETRNDPFLRRQLEKQVRAELRDSLFEEVKAQIKAEMKEKVMDEMRNDESLKKKVMDELKNSYAAKSRGFIFDFLAGDSEFMEKFVQNYGEQAEYNAWAARRMVNISANLLLSDDDFKEFDSCDEAEDILDDMYSHDLQRFLEVAGMLSALTCLQKMFEEEAARKLKERCRSSLEEFAPEFYEEKQLQKKY